MHGMRGNGVAKGKKPVGFVRFEILGLDQETKDHWEFLANAIKRLTNCYWRSWLIAHTQEGNDKRTQQYLADLKAWHEAGGKGTKPFCEVEFVTPEIQKRIRQAIKDHYAMVNDQCVQLAIQRLWKDAIKKKSSKGSVLRWIRILADDGEFPSVSSPQPIPFNSRNSGIIVPPSDDEDFQLYLHLDRIEQPGRKKATSTKQRVRLKTRDHKTVRKRAILWKIAEGKEYEFAGSHLVYRESKNKWFAHICYRKRKTAKPKVNPDRVAFLRPARQRPWWLRIDGYHHYMGGQDGRHVAHTRQQLLTSRWGRQESYKHASDARRGHGRDRANGRVYLLKDRWNDFSKTANERLVHDVVTKCVEEKCGRLIYYQPTGAARENRFLHLAGKVPGRVDNTSWGWSQVHDLLARKCKELGIELTTRKFGQRTKALR